MRLAIDLGIYGGGGRKQNLRPPGYGPGCLPLLCPDTLAAARMAGMRCLPGRCAIVPVSAGAAAGWIVAYSAEGSDVG